MILVKHTTDGWEYQLTNPEANCMRSILSQFPITVNASIKISKTENDPQAVDRQKLLDESLADHREMLKLKSKSLIGADKLKAHGKNWRLALNPEERETFLQILNDIRVGIWRALGAPEDFEQQVLNPTEQEQVLHNVMNLAGYFEHHLLNDPSTETT